MRRLVVIGLVLAAAGLGRADDTPAAAAKKLDGTYSLVELRAEGKPNPKGNDVTSVVIKDGVITIHGGGKKVEEAKFALDPTKTPRQIDLTPTQGREEKVAGIYETKDTDQGLELTIAFTMDGGPRPKDLTGAAKDEVVLKLLRKK